MPSRPGLPFVSCLNQPHIVRVQVQPGRTVVRTVKRQRYKARARPWFNSKTHKEAVLAEIERHLKTLQPASQQL